MFAFFQQGIYRAVRFHASRLAAITGPSAFHQCHVLHGSCPSSASPLDLTVHNNCSAQVNTEGEVDHVGQFRVPPQLQLSGALGIMDQKESLCDNGWMVNPVQSRIFPYSIRWPSSDTSPCMPIPAPSTASSDICES